MQPITCTEHRMVFKAWLGPVFDTLDGGDFEWLYLLSCDLEDAVTDIVDGLDLQMWEALMRAALAEFLTRRSRENNS